MNESEARQLLARARREPAAVADSFDVALDQAGDDPRLQSIVLRAMAIATLITDGAAASLDFAHRALMAGKRSEDAHVTVEAILTLSGALAFGGENEEAFELLEEARDMSHGNLNAEVIFQIGTLKARLGLSEEARNLFSVALPVFVENADDESIAMTLHNRGMINLHAGDLDQALDDFLRARDIEIRLGLGPAAAAVEHNIGVATALKGDLPTALEMLDQSEAKHLEFAESPAEVQVSRVEVLLSAGLFREADRLAERLAAELAAAGMEEDRAEAVLAWAMASRLTGETAKAAVLAHDARQMFIEQGRDAWARNAEQVALGARLDSGNATLDDFERARLAADQLDEADQAEAAFSARLTAGLIALECDERTAAISELRTISAEESGTVQRRLSSALAGSLVLKLEGDPAGAAARAGRGMNLLDEYQAVLGASDVRAGVEKHATRLGDLGLSLAAATGDPRELFGWMERARSRSMRVRPARDDSQAPYAVDLTSLRQVQFALRSASGTEATTLARRKAELERTIRNKSRYRDRTASSWSNEDAEQIVEALEDACLIEFAEIEGTIWRVYASSSGVTAAPLSTVAELAREVDWHRFALRRLARSRGDKGQADQIAAKIDELLFDGVELDRSRVVVVPIPSMYAFSWSSLPRLHNRELIVVPAAGLWQSRQLVSDSHRERAAVVVGPDLLTGVDEAGDVARIYGLNHRSTRLTTVEEALASLNGVNIAHVACHGSFEFENPLFSSLRLSDGDLHVYDVERLDQPPKLLVLSACDSGFSASQPGEELLGLTSALLAMGTATVVASVGLVPDTEETRSVMVEFHRRIVGGESPAVALVGATQTLSDDDPRSYVARRSFLCIGAG